MYTMTYNINIIIIVHNIHHRTVYPAYILYYVYCSRVDDIQYIGATTNLLKKLMSDRNEN